MRGTEEEVRTLPNLLAVEDDWARRILVLNHVLVNKIYHRVRDVTLGIDPLSVMSITNTSVQLVQLVIVGQLLEHDL